MKFLYYSTLAVLSFPGIQAQSRLPQIPCVSILADFEGIAQEINVPLFNKDGSSASALLTGGNITTKASAVSFNLPFFTTTDGLALDAVSVQFILNIIRDTTGLIVNETQALVSFVTCSAALRQSKPFIFGGFDRSVLGNGTDVDVTAYSCLVGFQV